MGTIAKPPLSWCARTRPACSRPGLQLYAGRSIGSLEKGMAMLAEIQPEDDEDEAVRRAGPLVWA